MENNNKYSQAAKQLLKRRAGGIKAQQLATDIRPHSINDALAVQMEMLAQHNDLVAGWKASLPPTKEQVVVAPIFAQSVNRGEECKLFADNKVARIEPEIAFILSKDLPAQQQDYSEQQIDQAVQGCYMALELIEDRFQENSSANFYERLADCLANQGVFIGPEIDKLLAYAASEITITVSQGDNKQVFAGKHPNFLPQNPLYWLINFMSKRGVNFKSGQVIITGSYAGVVDVLFDQLTEIDYCGLGRYKVEFKALP